MAKAPFTVLVGSAAILFSCAALAAASASGEVHRDLRPEFYPQRAQQSPLPSSSLRPCEEKDKQYVFTPCNVGTGIMQSVPFYDSAQCDPKRGPSLGAPRDTPCYIDCVDGEFYSPRTIGCERCVAGTFSRADAVTIPDFRNLPEYAVSFCFPKPCSSWVAEADGTIFSSGNQSGYARETSWGTLDETVESSFVILIDIVDRRGGSVSFSYRVESERGFDGLSVFVDGQPRTNPDQSATASSHMSARFWATGMLYQWRRATIDNIPYGRHQIKFAFTKDTNQMSTLGNEGVGTDRAYLRDISIKGVQSFAEKCDPCGPGTYSPRVGSDSCLPCEANTFSSKSASDRCEPCGPNEWSPPGSGTCRRKVKCTADDYVAMYGACDLKTRTRHRLWQLINTKCILDENAAPLDGEVPCSPCMRGKVPATNNGGECVACSEGFALIGNVSSAGASSPLQQCQKCPPSTAAIPVWDYSEGFDSFGGRFPSDFANQKCNGVCTNCADTNNRDGNCWFELASYPLRDEDGTVVGIRQSQFMGNFYSATLSIPVEIVSPGSVVEVLYAFVHGSSEGGGRGEGDVPVPNELSGVISFDGSDHKLDKVYTSTTKKLGKLTLKAPKGSHTIQFTVSQNGKIDFEDRFDVVILGLTVIGERRGGVPKCVPCPSGHYCPGGTIDFKPCLPGTYTYSQGRSECVACPEGFAQKEAGASFCNYCPRGTVASSDKKLCLNTCNISTYNGQWDLSPLSSFVFGPMVPDTVSLPPLSEDNPQSDSSATAIKKIISASATPISFDQLPSQHTQSQLDRYSVKRYYYSPCSFVNARKSSDRTCTRRGGSTSLAGDVEDAFVCERVDGDRSFSLGDDVSYSTYGGKLMQFISGGDACSSNPRQKRRTNITYVCEPSLSLVSSSSSASDQQRLPTLTYVNEKPACQYNFVLESRYGCPLCTADSFERVETECGENTGKTNNKDTNAHNNFLPASGKSRSLPAFVRKVSYYKKSSHAKCVGGYEPPAEVVTECKFCLLSDYKVVWSDCIASQQTPTFELLPNSIGCVDTAEFQQKRAAEAKTIGARECRKIDAKIGNNMFTVGLLCTLLGVGLAVTAAYVFYRKHADLSIKYQRLSSNVGGSLEMADYDDDDDDGREYGEGGEDGGSENTVRDNTGALGKNYSNTASEEADRRDREGWGGGGAEPARQANAASIVVGRDSLHPTPHETRNRQHDFDTNNKAAATQQLQQSRQTASAGSSHAPPSGTSSVTVSQLGEDE